MAGYLSRKFREWEFWQALIPAALATLSLISPSNIVKYVYMPLIIISFIIPLLLDYLDYRRFMNVKHVPYFIWVGGKKELEGAEGQAIRDMKARGYSCDLGRLYEHYGITRSDIRLWRRSYRGEGDVAEMEEELKDDLKRLGGLGSLVLHIFIKCPEHAAFRLGAVVGLSKSVVIWHWTGSSYIPVMDLRRPITLREEPGSDPLEVVEEGTGEKALIYLELTGKPFKKELIEEAHGEGRRVIKIKSKKPTLPLQDFGKEWLDSARAAYRKISQTTEKHREVTLHLSTPLPIAFALGMAASKLNLQLTSSGDSQNST